MAHFAGVVAGLASNGTLRRRCQGGFACGLRVTDRVSARLRMLLTRLTALYAERLAVSPRLTLQFLAELREGIRMRLLRRCDAEGAQA